jgi:LuxR family maltose regulon positive regulatory protein
MPGDELTNPPLLLTKFHRPIVPSDHVHRARLMEQLDKCYHRPLALVSAPAGYGKSTLVSALVGWV